MQTQYLTAAVALCLLTGAASAQEHIRPSTAAGPEVRIEAAPAAIAAEAGATRTFRMTGGFPGADVAAVFARRMLDGPASIAPLSLLPSPDGRTLSHIDPIDPSRTFQIDTRTGDFSFLRGAEGIDTEGNTPGLPKGQDAVRIALDHLSTLDLLPRDLDQLVVRHIGGVRMSSRREDGTVTDFDKLVTVHFGRRIDGVDVSGPGSKITVHLGAYGALAGMHRRWIEVVGSERGTEELLDRNEALDAVAEHLQREWHRAERVDAEAPEVGYFDDGEGRIEPAYFVKARMTYASLDAGQGAVGAPAEYFGVVPALRGSRARFDELEPAPVRPREASAHEAPPSPAGDDEPTRR